MTRRAVASRQGGEQGSRRSPLGLGLLETAIMQALWDDEGSINLPLLSDSLKYHRRVASTQIAAVVGVLCEKGLVRREFDDCPRRPGVEEWWYRAARPQEEHIGGLIATLLDFSADPAATLAHALVIRKTAISLDGSTDTDLPVLSGNEVADDQASSAEETPARAVEPR